MAFPYPYPAPYAYLNNEPIHANYFKPSVFQISNITLGATTVVTTSVDQNYVIGQLVRFTIPQGWGCRGLNGRTGYVSSIISDTQFRVELNSSNLDPFVNSGRSNVPQVAAIGDVNSGFTSSTGQNWTTTAIPGSFQNISP